jgi:hypothetical protein
MNGIATQSLKGEDTRATYRRVKNFNQPDCVLAPVLGLRVTPTRR